MRKRQLKQQLRSANRRAYEAQDILDTSREHLLSAQQKLWAERGRNAVPNTNSPTPTDLEVIAAIDHWLTVRRELEPALEQLRETWRNNAETLRIIESRRETIRLIFVNTARLAFPKSIAIADTVLALSLNVLSSQLSRNTIKRLARRSLTPDALQRYQRNNAYLIAALEHVESRLQTHSTHELHGGLPSEIATRVETSPLFQGPFTSVLRRYQDFGARYLIVQERTILGDEMGLGKTIQALAAMCHLHTFGARHFLVVAPNSVLINWQREITQHTTLTPVLLHGVDRDHQLDIWNTKGGVGVTTYGTLPKISHRFTSIDMFIADEAHYAKNPDAMRTAAVKQVAQQSRYVALLTGTALENRFHELQSLTALAQPKLAESLEPLAQASYIDPGVVATMLSSVYLRRTQKDVLKELPERVQIDEWIELSDDDYMNYLQAPPTVVQKRLATIIGDSSISSAKYERMYEIVAEHLESNRKVVIFSFFRDVLQDIASLLQTSLVINGDLSSSERQRIIDEFTMSDQPCVLVSQIDAGGVGVNLQAAQAVILMEAQLKPSTEWQAVARVHRMGQTRTVIVHRLLARGTIEERLVHLIAQKEELFYAYAHDSAVKDASLMAVDTKDAAIADELQRLLDRGEIS